MARRRRLRRLKLALAAVLVLALGVAGGAATAVSGRLPQVSASSPAVALGPDVTAGSETPIAGEGLPAQPEPSAPPVAADAQPTLLLATSKRRGGPASTLTLLAAGTQDTPPSVLFLPPGTLTEVPGIGLQPLALALQYGGTSLLQASVEGALGIAIDHVAAVSRKELAAFFERAHGLHVEVDRQLIKRRADGSARVRFEAGVQRMDGAELADYWVFTETDGEELDLFVRQQDLLTVLLGALAADDDLAGRMVADGAPVLGVDAEPGWVAAFFDDLADATEAGRLEYDIAPVEPFGGVDGQGRPTFLLVDGELEALVASYLGPSVPEGAASGPVRLQVLNGVGTPGLAEAVDRTLRGEGFRVVQTENAKSFDYAETRILVYDERRTTLDRAERVRELLGTGTIQISRQPQSMVDMSIVVGSDFADGELTGSESEPGRDPARME